MLKKTLALLLAVFSNLSLGQSKSLDDYFSLERNNIVYDEVHCFSDDELEVLSDEIKNGEDCEIDLESYKSFAEENYMKKEDVQFYQYPSVIIGGLVISLALGSMLGYMIGHK